MNAFEYKAKQWNLSGLNGISDNTLAIHFKLYEGYVTNTNVLNARIGEILAKGPVGAGDMPAYSELKRRYGFEYNGMVLHEYYFDNLKSGGSAAPGADSKFVQAAINSYGSFDAWKADFITVGKMRGVGWAVTLQDPKSGRISNHWISLHEEGNVAGYAPVLVMDVWEHAFLLDYKPADRPKYIDAFFSNIDWEVVDGRVK